MTIIFINISCSHPCVCTTRKLATKRNDQFGKHRTAFWNTIKVDNSGIVCKGKNCT